MGAVWFERDLTLKDVSVHCCGGKPSAERAGPWGFRLAGVWTHQLPWEVCAVTKFL